MRSETFAVDFDGTLCRSAWPGIGEPCYDMINWIKQLRQSGHKVILWTCRDGMHLVDAIVWCADHGLFFDAINNNLDEHVAQYGSNCRKVFADYYIDDKAVYPSGLPFIFERSKYGDNR
jgi:hypothetical protein